MPEEKKSGEGKKENIWRWKIIVLWRRRKIFGEEGGEEQQKRKRREIFGEGKYFFAGEKEKEVNIWRRKILKNKMDRWTGGWKSKALSVNLADLKT